MAEAQKGGEQSMDDILASIRRIISDDPASPIPAVVSGAGNASDNASVQSQSGVGATSAEGVATAQTANPSLTDDLSDILEPSAVPRGGTSGGVMPMTGGSEARGGAVQEATSWTFNADREAAESSGSLKSKLASLDGTSQTAVSLEPVMPRNDGISSSVMPDEEALQGKQNADVPIDDESTAVRPDVSGDGRVETPKVMAEPGPVGLKPVADGTVPIASVEAAVEQPAAVPAMPAKTMTAEALISDINKQEMLSAPGAGETNAASSADPKASTKLPAEARDDDTGVTGPVVAPGKSTPVVTADGAKTLEAMVVEALQPMLREWLDANLPRLVEDKLKAEIERLARDGELKSS